MENHPHDDDLVNDHDPDALTFTQGAVMLVLFVVSRVWYWRNELFLIALAAFLSFVILRFDLQGAL